MLAVSKATALANQMKIRTKILFFSLFCLTPFIAVGIFSAIRLNQIIQPLFVDIPESLSDLNYHIRLNSFVSQMRYYDEVLTQSARNYVFTGNESWRRRYNNTSPLLDYVIKQAISENDKDRQIFTQINTANLTLIDFEEKAIDLVQKGYKDKAVSILESKDYSSQKEIFQNNLLKLIEIESQNLDEVQTFSVDNLEEKARESQLAVSSGTSWILGTIFLGLIFTILIAIILSDLITRPLVKLTENIKQISSGNLNQEIKIYGDKEINDLAESFNQLIKKISQSQSEIEKKIEKRTANLKRLNKFMISRELKMVELKKTINALSKNEKTA